MPVCAYNQRSMQPTNVGNPDYFHRVVDCQWACPAHTNVPEYIRLIAQDRFTEAYLVNRASNVFPGILGRTCDRPCEPACRRTRVDGKPVAICRLKRVAADHRDEVKDLLPGAPAEKNGKRVALIGAGPASLTVANDLMPLGYQVTIFEKMPKPGGHADQYSPLSAPRRGPRRRDRLHHRHGRRGPLRHARRQSRVVLDHSAHIGIVSFLTSHTRHSKVAGQAHFLFEEVFDATGIGITRNNAKAGGCEKVLRHRAPQIP